MKKIGLLLLSTVLLSFTFLKEKTVDYNNWNALLMMGVDLQGTPKMGAISNYNTFKLFLAEIEKADPNAAHWTEDDKKCFWINAHNAIVLKMMVDNKFKSSVSEVSDAYSKKYKVAGEDLSITDLVNKVRAFKDQRLLFTLFDGTTTSPRLIPRPYWPSNKLEEEFDNKVKEEFKRTELYTFDKKETILSPTFEKYKADFKAEGEFTFINKFSTTQLTKKTKVKYTAEDPTFYKKRF